MSTNRIEIKDCEGVGGKRFIATGNPALFVFGVAVGVLGTLYVINRLNSKQSAALASTATDVISLLKAA